MKPDNVFGDGYGAGYSNQYMLGAGRLNSKAREIMSTTRVMDMGSWDLGFLLGSLVVFWREVDRGTETDRGEAGDSASAE